MAKPRKTDKRWWLSMGRPPFEEGDMVTPNGNYAYPGWPQGEYRRVLEVRPDTYEGRFWVLVVLKPGASMVSNWNPHNFMKQENAEMAAYEATKFFAVKLLTDYHEQTEGLMLETVQRSAPSDMSLLVHSTPLRSHRTQVQSDVKARIAEGDRWLVVQTVCLIEGEEPRPPIRVTEYK